MRPVVWTLAGTDPGGGAGIQGDLKTMNALGVHGCSVITALIAQNTVGVQRVEPVSTAMVQAQLDSLAEDLPPQAIKIGLLGSNDAIRCLAEAVRKAACFVVLDPVIQSSSGCQFLEPEALDTMKRELLPLARLLTPNLPEAELLLGRAITGAKDIQQAAHDLQKLTGGEILLKGGHAEGNLCADFWTDGTRNLWISSPRSKVSHTHGTGCTLSSAIASARALGASATDSLVIAKAYVNQGLRLGGGIGKGRGPLAHMSWPDTPGDLPRVSTDFPGPLSIPHFPPAGALGLYPLVDRAAKLEPLLKLGVKTLQLRAKDLQGEALDHEIQQAVSLGMRFGAKVYINDCWEGALRAGAYGVHLGQEDLATANLPALAAAGLRLGVSASSWTDLALLKGLHPSYVGIGAVFATGSKAIDYAPLGIEGFRRLRAMAGAPVVAIGGITLEHAPALIQAGTDGIAVISDLERAPSLEARVRAWQALLRTGAGQSPAGCPG